MQNKAWPAVVMAALLWLYPPAGATQGSGWATAKADEWVGRDAAELLLQLRVDGDRVQIEELESGETSYTWRTWNPAYVKQVVTGTTNQVVGMSPGPRGGAIINQIAHTKDVYVPATHRCEVTFYADIHGIIRRWEYQGNSCRRDISRPR